jgi:hypothetical protein
VLEKLAAPDTRVAYLDHRRELRGRPAVERPWTRRTRVYKGDLKAAAAAALAQNDYDGGGLHIPYGPGWDARRIDKLVYQSDLGMNSPFNPKNKKRRLHRHPAFFGTMLECIEDCCEHCPEPENDEEKKLQADEDASDKYIRGRIAFIQGTGSYGRHHCLLDANPSQRTLGVRPSLARSTLSTTASGPSRRTWARRSAFSPPSPRATASPWPRFSTMVPTQTDATMRVVHRYTLLFSRVQPTLRVTLSTQAHA